MKNLRLQLIATLLVFAVIRPALSDWKLGALAGGNYTTFTMAVDIGYNGDATRAGPSGKFGYLGGLATRYEDKNWAVEIDALYSQRTMSWHGSQLASSPTYGLKWLDTFRQIEIPVIGYYMVPHEKMNYRFGLGLYGSYGIGKMNHKFEVNVSGSTASSSGSYQWHTIGFRRLNFGGLLVLGADYELTANTKLTLDLRGQGTFSDVKNTENTNLFGDKFGWASIDLLVGILF